MSVRILYIGEIVGRVGVFAVKKTLPSLRDRFNPDFIIANAAGATGGSGIGKTHSIYLRKLGIDVITTGESAFFKKDIVEAFPVSPWLLRPSNHPPGVPGRGHRIYHSRVGDVAVIQLLGQAGFGRIHLGNPFHALDSLLETVGTNVPVVFEFRAATTAEKNAMFRHTDGRVSALIGSYARSLTSDARVSASGTAFITDAGMTGSTLSVCGMDAQMKIREFMSGIPVWAKDATALPEVQGCSIEIGDDGKARSIEAFRVACKEEFHDRTGNSDQA
ncbi:MAG: YmdB family metallophosphoesterase [Spirochaetales bacterium]|nr:MAG: YmdB family metallophosphoesterase [Spirochaetales bacterium]